MLSAEERLMHLHLRRRLGWTLCLVPFAAALALVGPGMVSRADGCSGATSTALPGWHALHWQSDLTAPVDAVVVLNGSVAKMEPAAALAALTVTLSDASGAPVDGTLSLETIESVPQGAEDVLVVFNPSAPLTAGASYSLHWEVDASAQAAPHLVTSGDATLKPVAAPSVKLAPATQPAVFGRKPELTGPVVHCSRGPNACPPSTSFGSEEILRPSLTASWSYVEGSSSQYQLTTVEPVDGKGDLLEVPLPQAHIAHTTATNRSVTIRFADELDEYCVRLVTRDLRDQSELVSEPLCATRTELGPPEKSLLEQALTSCLSPPTEALTGAWCKSHADDERCADEGGEGGDSCALAAGTPARSASALLFACAAIGLLGRRRCRARRGL